LKRIDVVKDFRVPSKGEIKKTNRIQAEFFGGLTEVFDPPLPEGVPERLKTIVEAARIARSSVVLDVGTGTGILIPLIHACKPKKILACDLSEAMLARLHEQYSYVETFVSDVRDLSLPNRSVNVVFLNACYPNIVDKRSSFRNISRMMSPGGRMVISHPLGKSFIDALREKSPFPLDGFPERQEADTLFRPYQFDVEKFVDEPGLYILVATKCDD
jgi:SAM-dependent methyltransferase